MNLFANASLWSDDSSGQSPPITWAAGDSRYEILVTPPEGQSETLAFWINLNQPAGPEDTIEFNYEVGEFNPDGSQQVYIKIISQSDGMIYEEEIFGGATGHVNVELVEGQNYSINITTSGGMDSHSFYGFSALLVPVMPAPIGRLPWWLCVRPDPPEPCPVRPTEFVPFDQYDADFKYPLASSRVPLKITKPEGCVVCAPTLVDAVDPPDPEPEPLCASITFNGGSPTILTSDGASDTTNFPSWFEWDMFYSFYLRFTDNPSVVFHFVWNEPDFGDIGYVATDYSGSGDPVEITNPSGSAEWAQGQDSPMEDWDWTCVNVVSMSGG